MLQPLAEHLAAKGKIVTFLAGRGNLNSKRIKTTLIPELDPENSHIRRLQTQINSGALPEQYENSVRGIEKKIETRIGYIDNIIIHNMMSMPLNLAATEALWNFMQKYPDKNYYIWTHDLAWSMDHYQDILYERRPWNLLKSRVPNGQYITVSEQRKKQIINQMDISKSKIKVIPNVIKFQDFLKFSKYTEQITGEWSIYNRFPVIMLPVRILPRKNIERSIRILANIKKYYPDFLAIITGNYNINDPYYQKIKSIIDELKIGRNIVFLHDILKEKDFPAPANSLIVRDLYFISHLVLFLSKDEGFGIPILEAGAARTPIVLSDLEVFREIAGDNGNYLSAELDITSAAEKLRNIISEKAEYLKLNTRVTRNYNWKFWWDRYLKKVFEK
jgi:glycosyltransferase involved in cell wall biosynthesis